jgi:hypothetical protein
VPSFEPGTKDNLIDIEDGFLTLAELIEAHGKIGSLMHAHSPYREGVVVEEIEKKFPVWRERLVRLLDNHVIQFPGDDAFLYVGMQSAETGSVHTSYFKKM